MRSRIYAGKRLRQKRYFVGSSIADNRCLRCDNKQIRKTAGRPTDDGQDIARLMEAGLPVKTKS
jgi:hypothetical protein